MLLVIGKVFFGWETTVTVGACESVCSAAKKNQAYHWFPLAGTHKKGW